ncbi:MAG: hypothetical protein OSA23_03430 [Rhodospirillales bacterium]|nr:hypothetical protein [Rhodospirillales bacterium]
MTFIDAIHKCGQVITKRLLTRKNDELDVAYFNKELDDIISYVSSIGDISDVKAKVVLMLERFKAERVE